MGVVVKIVKKIKKSGKQKNGKSGTCAKIDNEDLVNLELLFFFTKN